MKNRNFKILILIFLIFIVYSNTFAQPIQYPWESEIATSIPASYFGNPNNDYDMDVDNFGLHFIGVYSNPGTLKYYFLDNNGTIISQDENVGNNGSYVTAAAICCYQGKVYIALANNSLKKIRVYEKANTHPLTTAWTYRDEYNYANSNEIAKSIDMTADDYGLHISWGLTVYNEHYTNGEWGTIAIDPRQNGQIYTAATMGEMSGVRIDSRLKRKQIGTTGWTTVRRNVNSIQ